MSFINNKNIERETNPNENGEKTLAEIIEQARKNGISDEKIAEFLDTIIILGKGDSEAIDDLLELIKKEDDSELNETRELLSICFENRIVGKDFHNLYCIYCIIRKEGLSIEQLKDSIEQLVKIKR